jgi:hypothetical protein
MFKGKPAENEVFDKQNFPGAISNKELATRVVELLKRRDSTPPRLSYVRMDDGCIRSWAWAGTGDIWMIPRIASVLR